MRGSDLGCCQSSARLCETYAPPPVAERPHANNSTDNRDTCDAHKLSRAPGGFTRKTRGNGQKVARLGLTHNEKSHIPPRISVFALQRCELRFKLSAQA